MKSSDSENENDLEIWSHLETNKTFDGSSYKLHISQFLKIFLEHFSFLAENRTSQNWLISRHSDLSTDEVDGVNGSKRPAIIDAFHQTTPYSLLVQSLIKQLCNFFENDSEKSTVMYNKICAKLFEMKFIDESYERSEFENIRLSYEIALKQLFEVTRGNSLPVQDMEVWPLTHENPRAALEWSRYFRDFEEIEKIGEGGFGDVWKSKHKLDQIEYAVKKICVKATSVKNVLNHLKEVKTLASLSHVNIVPYKSCWLEPLIFYQNREGATIESIQTSSSSDESSISYTKSSTRNDSLRLKSDSFSINFEYSQEQKSEEKTMKSKSSVESRSNLEKVRRLNDANRAMIPHVKLTWAVLYIQMNLCEKTLRNFLDERNERQSFQDYYQEFPSFLSPTDDDLNAIRNPNAIAYSMFHQLCSGLEYIHNKGIVHHDIKPSNVFITKEESGSTVLQLGDFGLACPLENNEVVRHNGFGTRLYAAAEQLNGQCTKKSDIYSLGVILIELLSKCITVHECYNKVEKIKKGDGCSELDDDSCALIKALLSVKADTRPDISALKKTIQQKFESSANELDRLKRVISDKDDVIQQKDQQIDELMSEISKLRKQLSNTEV